MSTRGLSTGANGLTRASHITLRNMQRKLIQLAGVIPSRLRPRLHGPECKKDHAPFDPVTISPVGQREGRLSESSPAFRHRAPVWGMFCDVQGERLSHSFFLKLHQFADAVFEVTKAILLSLMCLFGGACIAGSILSLLFFATF